MLRKFIRDETAATAIEYGLIIALIALAIVGGAGNLGDYLRGSYEDMATKIQEVGETGP